MTKDHWVCKTLSHDWLVDIACPSGYSLTLITRRGVSLIDLIVQSLSTVTSNRKCLMDYRTTNFLDFTLPKFLGNNLLSNCQRTLILYKKGEGNSSQKLRFLGFLANNL